MISDFRGFAKLDRVKWNPRFYGAYPKFATELFHSMMTETGQPKEHTRRLAARARKSAGVSMTRLIRDGLEVYRNS